MNVFLFVLFLFHWEKVSARNSLQSDPFCCRRFCFLLPMIGTWNRKRKVIIFGPSACQTSQHAIAIINIFDLYIIDSYNPIKGWLFSIHFKACYQKVSEKQEWLNNVTKSKSGWRSKSIFPKYGQNFIQCFVHITSLFLF